VLIRRETPADIPAVRDVTAQAFASAPHSIPPAEPGGPPGEVAVLDELRDDAAWISALSLVAIGTDDRVVGHVVCSRGHVEDLPVLGLGPVSVHPEVQRTGVGSALMHAVLGAADAMDEPIVALVGDPAFYRRFGFRPSTDVGITAPTESWGDLFQVRTLWAHQSWMTGRFTYPEPFNRS
jgi:putative acetyltransferase